MKVLVNRSYPAHIDVVRQIAVGAQQPAALASACRRVEMRYLAARMHAGIGTAGAHNLDSLVGHCAYRPLDNLLHAETTALPLPAVVGRAVVFDTECDSHL